jgi:hypothetical protein
LSQQDQAWIKANAPKYGIEFPASLAKSDPWHAQLAGWQSLPPPNAQHVSVGAGQPQSQSQSAAGDQLGGQQVAQDMHSQNNVKVDEYGNKFLTKSAIGMPPEQFQAFMTNGNIPIEMRMGLLKTMMENNTPTTQKSGLREVSMAPGSAGAVSAAGPAVTGATPSGAATVLEASPNGNKFNTITPNVTTSATEPGQPKQTPQEAASNYLKNMRSQNTAEATLAGERQGISGSTAELTGAVGKEAAGDMRDATKAGYVSDSLLPKIDAIKQLRQFVADDGSAVGGGAYNAQGLRTVLTNFPMLKQIPGLAAIADGKAVGRQDVLNSLTSWMNDQLQGPASKAMGNSDVSKPFLNAYGSREGYMAKLSILENQFKQNIALRDAALGLDLGTSTAKDWSAAKQKALEGNPIDIGAAVSAENSVGDTGPIEAIKRNLQESVGGGKAGPGQKTIKLKSGKVVTMEVGQ